MSQLSAYRKKRNARNTPEPRAKTKRSSGELIFVVQKHHASHLHYDLRLECDGVLKSWAIPRGPSTHPEDKRLAVMVEDHPYDYKDFEGDIPKGNYGAGHVAIWDKGTYEVPEAADVADAQKKIRAGLKKGHIAFVLKGKKLKGEFALIRTGVAGPKSNWLLFAKSHAKTKSPGKVKADKRPAGVTPMLTTLVEEPFNKKGWIFELKLDGYRALADITEKTVTLISRNQKSLNKDFPGIVKELAELKRHSPILDGEVVVLDELGRSNFQLLQNNRSSLQKDIYYYVFDLLYCDGLDLRELPLIERKERLEILLQPLRNTHIRYSDHIEEKGISLFREAQKNELEGIIAKNAQSTYQMRRSRDWQKIKTQHSEVFVIGGFAKSRGAGGAFGSLMLGKLKGKELIYVGQVGTGFSMALARSLLSKLKPLVTVNSPFKHHPKLDMPVTYVRPTLLCLVSFTEMTKEGLLRHPVFEGLDVHQS